MVLRVEPEVGIPIDSDVSYDDLKEYIEAAANTAQELVDSGLSLEPTKEDEEVAARLTHAYAENPEYTSRKVTLRKAATLTPASLVLTNNILTEFGQLVAENAAQIRHMVTNKLILETDNPDPRVRIRALELLGKISDVGLFAEKSEVTVTHQSTDDLRLKLRSKLAKLVNPEDDNVVIIDNEVVDIDNELGTVE
jgi:ribosomal protein S24E